MKSRLFQAFFCAILVASCAHAEPQSAAPKHVTAMGHLSCGGAALTAETVYLDVPDRDFQPLSQRITLQQPGYSPTVLHHDGRPRHQPFLQDTAVLDAGVPMPMRSIDDSATRHDHDMRLRLSKLANNQRVRYG